jgi:hypothetical protein
MDLSARSFPTASLWREKAVLSPFQRSLHSLPPLLGLRPATKRAIPLGTPAALLPQISKLAPSEKPCPLSRPRTSSSIPFALGDRREECPRRCGGLSYGLPLRPFPETATLFHPLLILQERMGRLMTSNQSLKAVSDRVYRQKTSHMAKKDDEWVRRN